MEASSQLKFQVSAEPSLVLRGFPESIGLKLETSIERKFPLNATFKLCTTDQMQKEIRTLRRHRVTVFLLMIGRTSENRTSVIRSRTLDRALRSGGVILK